MLCFIIIYRHLKLNLAAVSEIIINKCSLIDFLLLRPNSKDTTLRVPINHCIIMLLI